MLDCFETESAFRVPFVRAQIGRAFSEEAVRLSLTAYNNQVGQHLASCAWLRADYFADGYLSVTAQMPVAEAVIY